MLLKRLEASGLLQRTRNASNERQVVIALTDAGRALQHKAGCLSDTLLAASTQTPEALAALNRDVRGLRNAIYSQIGGWTSLREFGRHAGWMNGNGGSHANWGCTPRPLVCI